MCSQWERGMGLGGAQSARDAHCSAGAIDGAADGAAERLRGGSGHPCLDGSSGEPSEGESDEASDDGAHEPLPLSSVASVWGVAMPPLVTSAARAPPPPRAATMVESRVSAEHMQMLVAMGATPDAANQGRASPHAQMLQQPFAPLEAFAAVNRAWT